MKIIDLKHIRGSEREVHCIGCVSNRILLERDKVGFTMTITEIPKGDWQHWHYKNHFEACYCISGCGLLRDLDSKETYLIKPGVTYVLDKYDDHKFMAVEDTVLLCVFNPPLKGKETHDAQGNYTID